MRTLPVLFTLFGSWLILMAGLGAKNPFPNFAGFMLIRVIYYLFSAPRRRKRQYWRQRRHLQNEYMRRYLRNNPRSAGK